MLTPVLLTHYASVIGSEELHQFRDHTCIYDSLDALGVAISEVGESPACVTHHLHVRVLNQVLQGRKDLGGEERERLSICHVSVARNGGRRWVCDLEASLKIQL